MSINPLPLKTAVAAVLPLLACFGYYTVGRLDNPSAALSFAAIFAAPLALVGLAGTLSLWFRQPRRSGLLIVSALALLAPAIFLVVVWS
jgi:hypothetical protein